MQLKRLTSMQYNIISTGSHGNCTIINDSIAIDMGITYKKLGEYSNKIKLVLLTHIHKDHLKPETISVLTRNHPMIKFVCMDYLVPEISKYVSTKNIYVLEPNKRYDIGICILAAFPLTHDVPNVGWRIQIGEWKCIYATDTNTLDGINAKNYDLYLIEGNYVLSKALKDIRNKQKKGEFAYEFRAVQNHLSTKQMKEFLKENMGKNSEFVQMHKHIDKHGQEMEINNNK